MVALDRTIKRDNRGVGKLVFFSKKLVFSSAKLGFALPKPAFSLEKRNSFKLLNHLGQS